MTNPDTHSCPICGEPFKLADICATDITEGPCHAACLEGSPVVDLGIGEELPGGEIDTYPYSEVADQTPETQTTGRWLPIAQADKTITDVQEFAEVGMTIKTSDRYWVRDDDGRIYEAAWSEGRYGRDYWWDFEGESPVDPVEFMPHPLDTRFDAASE